MFDIISGFIKVISGLLELLGWADLFLPKEKIEEETKSSNFFLTLGILMVIAFVAMVAVMIMNRL